LYSGGELWQGGPEGWVYELAGGGAEPGSGVKQLLGLSESTKAWPAGRGVRNSAAQMGSVGEIMNSVKAAFSPPALTSRPSRYESQITASMATKWEQQDPGNNGNRSHLSASATPLFLLVLDDVCVTSSICFWFLGAGFLWLCGTVLLQLNVHVASSASCSVLTFRC